LGYELARAHPLFLKKGGRGGRSSCSHGKQASAETFKALNPPNMGSGRTASNNHKLKPGLKPAWYTGRMIQPFG